MCFKCIIRRTFHILFARYMRHNNIALSDQKDQKLDMWIIPSQLTLTLWPKRARCDIIIVILSRDHWDIIFGHVNNAEDTVRTSSNEMNEVCLQDFTCRPAIQTWQTTRAYTQDVLTWAEWSQQDTNTRPEVRARPGDVDRQLSDLTRSRVRVDDVESEKTTHTCNRKNTYDESRTIGLLLNNKYAAVLHVLGGSVSLCNFTEDLKCKLKQCLSI